LFEAIKKVAGGEAHRHIEREAEKEVALSMRMPLLDKYHQTTYYALRRLLGEFLSEFESFEKAGLKVSPLELVTIIFKCKLLFACKTEQEFGQRCGGLYPLGVDSALIVRWSERIESADVLIARHIAGLEAGIRERTMVSHISSVASTGPDPNPQTGFQALLTALGFPFVCFFDGDHLIQKHRELEPGLRSYDQERATRFFSAPSIGFRASGSKDYCFWYSTTWLRTFLNLLRIASYIHPGQVDFGMDNVQMTAPTFPVFLGEHAQGAYKWDEDKIESWAKIPDGCLFRSFGFRGLSKAWFDRRTLPNIEKLLLNQKKIFDCLKNPWNPRNTRDVAPALDILSSATQMPDVGVKILLIYCCLEHLFVPKNIQTDNKKYIVGGMNALAPDLMPWFERLYRLRCDYAHKGFILRTDDTLGLIIDSMRNVMTLLVAKLSVA
jgi:hypothetical protein